MKLCKKGLHDLDQPGATVRIRSRLHADTRACRVCVTTARCQLYAEKLKARGLTYHSHPERRGPRRKRPLLPGVGYTPAPPTENL
jgi:hypothetical protein